MNEKNKIKNANAACRAARSLHWPIFIILCLLLKSCNKQSTVTHFSQNVMTIDYHIQIGDPLTKAQKEKVQTIIADTFSETDRIYNKWNPHSELSYINALPAHTPHTLSPELLHLFQKIDFFVAISKGKFDPTIEPLSQLWKAKLEQGLTPTEDEIQIIKPSIGWNRIIIKNGILTKQHSQTQIDLGGIAKGFCIDLLIDRLNKESFENVYVEWGGDIRAIGHHPLGRPWRISIKGIEKPGQSIATFDLINKAIATSGDYFQYWQINDKYYCHIFNPSTLQPLEIKPGSIGSASLLATKCVTADALAKVLMFFETEEEIEKWINELGKLFPEISYYTEYRKHF